MAALLFQDPLPLRRHRFPRCSGHTSPVPQVPYDQPHPRDGQPVLTIPTNRGGCAAPTRLMRPASGALRAQHDSCGRARSCLPVGGIEPWCRRPHGTPTTPFRLLGEPLHRFSRPPSQVSALGSPRRFGGVSWNASGPTCTRALRTRCGIEFCGPLARVRRFRCVSHQLPHGLIPTLPTVTAYLPRYHRHRSTMIRPCDPPQRASLL